jgi:hypothetical protein
MPTAPATTPPLGASTTMSSNLAAGERLEALVKGSAGLAGASGVLSSVWQVADLSPMSWPNLRSVFQAFRPPNR